LVVRPLVQHEVVWSVRYLVRLTERPTSHRQQSLSPEQQQFFYLHYKQ